MIHLLITGVAACFIVFCGVWLHFSRKVMQCLLAGLAIED